jgi:hypothetical protein
MSKKSQSQPKKTDQPPQSLPPDRLAQVQNSLYDIVYTHMVEVDGLPVDNKVYEAIARPTIEAEVNGLIQRLKQLIGSESGDW